MSWQPGLITHIDDDGMSVKVPTGADCAACPGKSACTFQGPDSSYRTLRVQHLDGCAVGDRLMVDEPGSVLAVTLMVVVGLPVVLMLGGYALAECCVRFPYATLLLWVSGVALWAGGLVLVNRWMIRAPMFQTTIRRPAELADTLPDHHAESKDA